MPHQGHIPRGDVGATVILSLRLPNWSNGLGNMFLLIGLNAGISRITFSATLCPLSVRASIHLPLLLSSSNTDTPEDPAASWPGDRSQLATAY